MEETRTAAFTTDLPARLDRLPWSGWHRRVIVALGITWMLDGLEVTLVGTLGGALERPDTLGLTSTEVGLAGSVYIAGAMLGALVFGALTDRLGRKRLFLVTLAIYLAATALTATSWSFASFAVWRFVTGAGIGGEYAAMNSAIDELVPARLRGAIDLAVNGTFWVGTAAGAGLSLVLLDASILPPWLGWRLGFAAGALLGFAILLVRRHLPESPRWLLTRGRVADATSLVEAIEREVHASTSVARGRRALGATPPRPDGGLRGITIHPHAKLGIRRIARILFVDYRTRALVSLVLMLAQAFFYNAIFFTYALVLTHFYGVPEGSVGLYVLPFAAGNFLGPLVLGRLFDSLGRRRMIALTYVSSGLLLVLVAFAFERGALGVTALTALWSLVFFFASSAASSAYLTVSEVFPLEVRAVAIAVFYALGTGAGGAVGPAVFGALIESQSRREVFAGYLIGSALMILAGFVAWRWGVDAERKALEEIAVPLSSRT